MRDICKRLKIHQSISCFEILWK